MNSHIAPLNAEPRFPRRGERQCRTETEGFNFNLRLPSGWKRPSESDARQGK